MRPSLPSREVAPRLIAAARPSLPSLDVPPGGTATTRPSRPMWDRVVWARRPDPCCRRDRRFSLHPTPTYAQEFR